MSPNDVMQMIASLVESQKETDRQLKETDRQQKETALLQKETEKQVQRTTRQVERTTRELREARAFFNDQWGKLVEALLGSGLPELFRARGIRVTEANPDAKFYDNDTGRKLAQVDVMIRNGREHIAVEVKTTCRPKEVDEHLERLERLRDAKQIYADGTVKLLGAVASLSFVASADAYAERKGLFVLKCGDGVVSIQNSPDFQPKAF